MGSSVPRRQSFNGTRSGSLFLQSEDFSPVLVSLEFSLSHFFSADLSLYLCIYPSICLSLYLSVSAVIYQTPLMSKCFGPES